MDGLWPFRKINKMDIRGHNFWRWVPRSYVACFLWCLGVKPVKMCALELYSKHLCWCFAVPSSYSGFLSYHSIPQNYKIIMMMESRRVLITDEDRGPIVNIATWIALVVMSIIVSMKTISRWATIHKLRRDDFYIIVAMVLHPLIPCSIRTRSINTRSIVNHCWSVRRCCRTS